MGLVLEKDPTKSVTNPVELYGPGRLPNLLI